MGTTGRSGISKILMGSVTEKVIREVPCSFITVKNEDIVALELESKIQDIENYYSLAQNFVKMVFLKNQFISIKYAWILILCTYLPYRVLQECMKR
jgi:hypothetical protein